MRFTAATLGFQVSSKVRPQDFPTFFFQVVLVSFHLTQCTHNIILHWILETFVNHRDSYSLIGNYGLVKHIFYFISKLGSDNRRMHIIFLQPIKMTKRKHIDTRLNPVQKNPFSKFYTALKLSMLMFVYS